MRGPAFFAYADNYLVDVKFGVIVDVQASRAIRQAEVGAAKTMIERTEQRFDLKPEYLAADTAYGSAATLNWIITEKKIAPHIPVIDKSKREDGTFSREDFLFDPERNVYTCPASKVLRTTGTVVNVEQLLYRASNRDCGVCPLKMRCCPKEPRRKIPRSIHEQARDVARELRKTEEFERSRHNRKRVAGRMASAVASLESIASSRLSPWRAQRYDAPQLTASSVSNYGATINEMLFHCMERRRSCSRHRRRRHAAQCPTSSSRRSASTTPMKERTAGSTRWKILRSRSRATGSGSRAQPEGRISAILALARQLPRLPRS